VRVMLRNGRLMKHRKETIWDRIVCTMVIVRLYALSFRHNKIIDAPVNWDADKFNERLYEPDL
jgi:hypothetical protein